MSYLLRCDSLPPKKKRGWGSVGGVSGFHRQHCINLMWLVACAVIPAQVKEVTHLPTALGTHMVKGENRL